MPCPDCLHGHCSMRADLEEIARTAGVAEGQALKLLRRRPSKATRALVDTAMHARQHAYACLDRHMRTGWKLDIVA